MLKTYFLSIPKDIRLVVVILDDNFTMDYLPLIDSVRYLVKLLIVTALMNDDVLYPFKEIP